jgi:transposase
MLARTLVAARTRLVRIGTELSNQIRGLMKTFGLVVPPASGSKFERQVEALLADNADLGRIIRPLLEAWHAVRLRAAELGRKLLADARRSDACQLLMSIPGVGVVTATSFVTAIEDPANFKHSRSVGAWVGLTTRRYQSGEIDYDGHISRRGDSPPARGSSTKPRRCCSSAAGQSAICANGGCSCGSGSASSARPSQSPASSRHHAHHADYR